MPTPIPLVGIVAINHEIAVGIDIAKHLSADVALTLTGLVPDYSAALEGDSGSAVGRIVVVNVDRRLG